MITNERECRSKTLEEATRHIMAAGRTAPKSKGVDILEIVAVTAETACGLSEAMRKAAEETQLEFFLRDADNLGGAEVVILVGTQTATMNLNCGYCGHACCGEKQQHPQTPCALNTVDVGIAVGSMVSRAADLRIDCRVMFSAGYAAQKMGLMPECSSIIAIPLSISSKNPFFDRRKLQPETE